MNIIVKKLLGAIETQGKYRTMTMLRNLPEYQLRDVGISPELLSMGVRAWPWQLPKDAVRVYPYLPTSNMSALRVGKVADSRIELPEQSAA